MNILVIGSGGREHALAWKAAQSSQVTHVYVAPGNAGTAMENKISNIDIAVDEINDLILFSKQHQIQLAIVGPEVPLSLGIVDKFQQQNLQCFGPSQAAAQLEASKTFCKNFMKKYHIPTADYESFSELQPAIDYIKKQGAPIVIKADGLAAGKGVVVAQTEQQAITTVTDMLAGNAFGDAGHRVVIEEFLTGEEASFIVMSDGKHILPLATSQDHKARDDGDLGPNTGGMGAYSPAKIIDDILHQKIMDTIIQPTIQGLAAEGTPYCGFLYAGLMIDSQGNVKVLEYNCRFGDPETQPIMMRLRSDLVTLCLAAMTQQLNEVTALWDERVAVGVVLAAGGYPEKYAKGDVITGLDNINEDKTKIFHAGTKQQHLDTITAGGRVLCVTSLGDSATEAQSTAYNAVAKVQWPNMYYRKDIAYRAIQREQSS